MPAPTGARLCPALLGASVATALALVILIGLGLWQLQRLHWKQGMIARIDAAEQAPPVALGDGTPPLFTRVRVSGTLAAGPPGAVWRGRARPAHGAQSVQLLDRPGQKPVLVVLGWIPTDMGAPKPLAGPANITGYVRLPEHPDWLSAADDLQGRHFYTLNPIAIGASLGAADVAPFTLVALGQRGAGSATACGRPAASGQQPPAVRVYLVRPGGGVAWGVFELGGSRT